jgi:NRPS condensation-like uncharacterized protein
MNSNLPYQSLPTVQIDDMLSTIDIACDLQIHAIIEFEDHLQEKLIQKALFLCTIAEPILGCHLKKEFWKQRWIRLSDQELEKTLETKYTKNLTNDLQSFMCSSYSPEKDASLRAIILRTENFDTICFKLSHVALDGGGTKEFLKLFIDIYNNLLVDKEYLPPSNLKGNRDFHQVTSSFLPKERLKHLQLNFRDYFNNLYPFKGWQYPKLGTSTKSSKTYIFHTMDSELMKNIKKIAVAENLSTTDLLIAAIYRALFIQIRPDSNTQLKLGLTVDLRNYLKEKKGGALCNLAAMFYLNIGNSLGDNILETAKKVSTELDNHKKTNIGMGDNRYMIFDLSFLPFSVRKNLNLIHQIFKLIIGTKKLPPLFTYGGKIDFTLRKFKDLKIKRAFLTAPIAYSPVFFIGISSFRGDFTISSGIVGSEDDKKIVKNLFQTIEDELSDLNILFNKKGNIVEKLESVT